MKSPHDGFDEPSEITEAFRPPAGSRLEPEPGTYDALRRRATGRRRRRVAAVAASVVVCLAGTTMAVLTLTPSDDDPTGPVPLASDERDASTDPSTESSEPPTEESSGEPSSDPVPDPDPSTEAPPDESTDPDPVDDTPETCDAAQLDVTDGPANSGAGSVMFSLRFTNTGDVACTLTGYPGVSLVAGSEEEQVGSAATRSDQGGDPEQVVLEPGAMVQSDVRLTRAENYPEEDCDPQETSGLLVYPPDETESFFLPYTGIVGCANEDVTLLDVTVVHEP